MDETGIGLWGVPLAILGGAIRVSTPFLFVSLGECITENARPHQSRARGHARLRRDVGYAIAYQTGSPWIGVLAAAFAGACFGALPRLDLQVPKVNDIAIGIALMLFGTGLAFFFGKPFIQPVAPDLPAISFGFWSDIPQVQAALKVNVLFLIGIVLAVLLWWGFAQHRGSASSCAWSATAPTRRAPWALDRLRAASCHRGRRRARRRSAAPISRSIIRAAGTRASRRARG